MSCGRSPWHKWRSILLCCPCHSPYKPHQVTEKSCFVPSYWELTPEATSSQRSPKLHAKTHTLPGCWEHIKPNSLLVKPEGFYLHGSNLTENVEENRHPAGLSPTSYWCRWPGFRLHWPCGSRVLCIFRSCFLFGVFFFKKRMGCMTIFSLWALILSCL